MSFEDTRAEATNAVRHDPAPPANVHPFPAGVRVRITPADDRVAVTHAGQTTVYATPRALGEAVLGEYEAAIQARTDRAVETALAAYRRAQGAAHMAPRLRAAARERLLLIGLVLGQGLLALAHLWSL
jgi:hypothetical protein